MRRQDVEIGVEYAATGALAYGREPDRTKPRRVRFTDTRPGPWLRVVTLRYTEGASKVEGGNAWQTSDTKIVHRDSTEGRVATASYPLSFANARPDNPAIGAEVTYVDASIKGGLPGEIYRRNHDTEQWEWYPTLVVPAEIHRTWEAVQGEMQAKAERAARLDKDSKVSEINDLLGEIGLGKILKAQRRAVGVGVIISADGQGPVLLRELTDWIEGNNIPRRRRKPAKGAKS